uniref:SCO family protein n=1 Tax=Sandarakinorhabdus rubra TaxID=2672568 RepID=UPI0013DA4287
GGLGWLRFARPAPAEPQGNLAGASLGGPFTLTDQDGRRVSDRDFAGRWRLIYFGYAFCPDVCPTDLALLGRGLAAFEQRSAAAGARVAPIFITIDPARDTPAVLKPYVAAFHPRLVGLTGTAAEIAAVTRAFGVYAKQMPGGDADAYLMDHSAMVYLFGPDGRPVAFLPHDGLSAEAITALLATHVR